MKRILTICLLIFLTACTARIYGVPQETWNVMSETERIAAIELYKEWELAYQRTQQERARQHTAELELRRAREAEEARIRRIKVDAIYRGKGHHGDLIRVTLKGGTAFGRGYHPVSFKIADGETKRVTMSSKDGREFTLRVSYLDGNLIVDLHTGSGRKKGRRFAYDPAWSAGKAYAGIVSDGPSRLQGASVYIETLGGGKGKAKRRTAPELAEEPRQGVRFKKEAAPPKARTQPVEIVKERPDKKQAGKTVDSEAKGKKRGRVIGKDGDKTPKPVKVSLTGGKLRGKGKQQSLRPVKFNIRDGERRKIRLESGQGHTFVTVRYQDRVLFIEDPEGGGDIELPYETGWVKGKEYRVKTREEGRSLGLRLNIRLDQ